ncbi:AAA family ATPase [Akkermansiaceae bacterium]|nr:AAA family ATPase [Akkermansiaceae bacterium]MDB4698264.1 AAA family ATPase [Akkermansiaceae bacterium]
MKLTKIQLHPFGGSANRTCLLHDGVNVIEGPNEFGKSTMNKALWHALFTPSHLTPANLRKTMGRWFPKPDGDHARVTLEFVADGQEWILQKTWGAGASSALQANGGASIADPGAVQARLFELLRRNQATWQNVLFVSQAQLTRTIQKLQENADHLDDLQPLLAGAAAIPGDIAPEKLSTAIEHRISNQFSRWDITANGPENGKGVTDPWKARVGPQLKAYYAMKTVEHELSNVVQHEEEVDRINGSVRELEGVIDVDREFVDNGRTLKDKLAKHEGLEERAKRIENEQGALKDVMKAWPGADQVIQGKQEELTRVEAGIHALDKELKNAKQRAGAEQLKNGHKQLKKTKGEWKKAADRLEKSKPIPSGTLSELESLASKIDGLRIKIAAQKLSASIKSGRSKPVTITRGTNEPEEISIDPAQTWEGKAEGKVRFEIGELQIQVESGSGDVATLFDDLQTTKHQQKEILQDLELKDLAAAKAADAHHKVLVGEEERLNGLFTAALQGKIEDEWTSEVAAVESLPSTRSVDVLNNERNDAVDKKASLSIEIGQEKKKVEKWTEEYENLDKLMSKVLAKTGELEGAQKELAELPPIPDGFESVSDYLEELKTKETVRQDAEGTLRGLKIQQAELVGRAPEQTAEELREDLEFKEREFQRQEETGRALLRISSELEKIVSQREDEDPMKGLESSVARHFQDLTFGRYESVRLDGANPVEVSGPFTLETGLLSQGTIGSLALATRLALAELYLGDLEGFLVLDDPFTDMDPDRREAAERCLGGFGENRQVIFFTCHPDHAMEVKRETGIKAPEITG